ncbi:MAG: MerR family transcriptional regulator [Bdellovibrionales bacterium]
MEEKQNLVPTQQNMDEMLADSVISDGYVDGYVTADSEAFWVASEETIESSAPSATVDSEVLEMAPPAPAVAEVSFMDAELLAAIDQIPDKMAFKIGEAAEILDIRPYVLRYWESEFDELRPKKSNHNQRMYSRNDVKVAMMIKKLLYKDRFSIEGARKALKKLRSNVKQETEKRIVQNKIEKSFDRLHEIVDDLSELKQLFS